MEYNTRTLLFISMTSKTKLRMRIISCVSPMCRKYIVLLKKNKPTNDELLRIT